MSASSHKPIFDGVFDWFESLPGGGVVVDRASVGKFWTDDARMVTNEKVMCDGIDDLVHHFEQFPSRFAEVTIQRPYLEFVESGDKVAAEYLIEGTSHEHEIGTFHIMAIFTVRDGRIAQMREIATQSGMERSFKVGDF